MTEEFEYKGYWYLPSKPNNAVAGILTFIPNKSIILELIGSLDKENNDIISFSERTSIYIIWGVTSDANKISLINCTPSGGKLNLSCTFPISKYSIQYCLDGIHIKNFDEKRFSWSNIDIPALTMWCFPAALKSKLSFNKENRVNDVSVSFNKDEIKIPLSSVKINNTTTLNIKKNVNYNSSEFTLNPTFSQNTFLQIKKNCKFSISNILLDIYLFEGFISLATLSSVKASNIFLYDKTNFQELNSKKKIYHTIKLLYIQRDTKIKNNLEYDFLFTYNQIKDRYSEIIKKWYNETKEIAPIRAHMIESVKNKNIFNSTDFLIVIQAIEGYCIRFRKEQSLTKILEDIINEFNDIRIINQLNINIKAVVDSRHYYSHFMNKDKKPNTLDGLELFKMTKKLRILLICCLLNFIGINNQEINNLLINSNNRKLR